jgi:hypothetical protein
MLVILLRSEDGASAVAEALADKTAGGGNTGKRSGECSGEYLARIPMPAKIEA